ncbi:MAG: hypothetical protein ABSD10_01935 [Candidatus Saccharimonadales bacterium]
MVKKGAKGQPKKAVAANAGRVRKLTKKQQKAKAKKQAQNQTPIPGSFHLTKQVFSVFRKFWKPLGGILLVYLILNIIFTTGFISDLNSTASTLKDTHHLSSAFSGFGSLLGSGTTGTQSSSAAQSLLLVLESLVIIWALRQLLAGEHIRVKQAYYRAMAPLVPFLLVIVVIILQLLPITLGATVLALVLSTAITSSSFLTVIFSTLFALLAAWSFYMLCSSIFALYIVTLPDMQPRQALRSAKELVHFRRLQIMRRLLFLPICILVIMAVIIIPLILLVPVLVVVAFFALAMLAILFAHTYLYSLYRGLIA